MKAVYLTGYGAIPNVVEYGDLPTPALRPHDLLVKVEAASVNPIDNLTAAGFLSSTVPLEMPAPLGNDIAGVVTQTGPEVTEFQVGDAVFARLDPARPGAFAEYAVVDAGLAARKPARLSFEEAASLPLVGVTAWQALVEKANLREGQTVLVHAGSGGVGAAAIQIAKHLGATVITTAGPESLAAVKELGADQVIDYRGERFEEAVEKVDVVLDTVGGETQDRSFEVLVPGGILVSLVGVADATEKAERYGVRVESFFMRPDGAQLATLASLVESGALRPVLDRSYPLGQVAEALLYSQTKRAKGKITIRVA